MNYPILFIHIILYTFLVLLAFYFGQQYRKSRLDSDKSKREVKHLNELDHTKQVFLSSMTHRIRTPLAGAKWALEEVLKGDLLNKVALIEQSHDKVNDALVMVGQVLKTSELEINKGNINLKKESVDLQLLIKKILLELNYLIDNKGIKVKYERCESLLTLGDVKMLDLALANIFDNAFRYSPHGEIRINLFQSNSEAVLTVEDNGVGIDSNDLEFITFQKFYRGKNAMEIDPNESGVGLYATRKIIELHDGRMAISSILGKGTKVSVTLPLQL